MQVPYGSQLYVPQTSYHLPAAQQEPHKKAYLLANTREQFSGNKSQENLPLAEKGQHGKSNRTR